MAGALDRHSILHEPEAAAPRQPSDSQGATCTTVRGLRLGARPGRRSMPYTQLPKRREFLDEGAIVQNFLVRGLDEMSPFAECRLPESVHFAECDPVIRCVVRVRSVHKVANGHTATRRRRNRSWPEALKRERRLWIADGEHFDKHQIERVRRISRLMDRPDLPCGNIRGVRAPLTTSDNHACPKLRTRGR